MKLRVLRSYIIFNHLQTDLTLKFIFFKYSLKELFVLLVKQAQI